MKLKFIALVVAFSAAFAGLSNAVTVSLIGVANDAVGRITLDGANASGRAVFVSTSTTISADAANGAFGPLILGGGSAAEFDSALNSLVGLVSANSPGVVRSVAFTDGILLTNAPQELGDAGNKTYLFIFAGTADAVSAVGAYTGANVPALGAVNINPGTAGDLLGTSASGFQLVAVVPEPSAMILGLAGMVAFVRRRR